MDEVVDNLISFVQGVMSDIDNIDDEEFEQILAFLQESIAVIQEQQPIEAPIPLGADLLWQLAGSNPGAFIDYLRSVPDPALNALARNPTQLESLINRLSQEMPAQLPRPVEAGIEKAPLNSSNIWGFHYSPKTGDLLVRFQGGNVYHYGGVPPQVFKIFQAGAIPAKTDGQNAYGKWWKTKMPSLGAAFYELIRSGPYPYQQVA